MSVAAPYLTRCSYSSPSEPNDCVRLDGAYSFTYAEAGCGASGGGASRDVVLTQNGCDVNAVLPGYALLDGTVHGSTLVFSLTLLASGNRCPNAHLSGTATVSFAGGGITILGTYGTANPLPSGCACLPAVAAGSLTLRS
jgi:hypothetical protein